MAVGLVSIFYVRFSLKACVHAMEMRLVDEMFGLLMVKLFFAGFRFSFLVTDFILNGMSSMVIETFEFFILFIGFS